MAVYLGNPNAHNLSAITHGPAWLRVLGTQNLYSASTVDQMPKQVSAGYMFGTMLSVPIPDVDRRRPPPAPRRQPAGLERQPSHRADMRGRLRAIRERGGKVVVVDPRRTRTADEADEHHFIRPGTDALLLAALACTLVEEGQMIPARSRSTSTGSRRCARWCATSTPEAVAELRHRAGEIRRMARELAAAERAAVYARIGTCTQEFGTHASWLVDVLNALTGNLDREGGVMWPKAAVGRRTPRAAAAAGAASASGAGRAGCAGCPSSTASCRSRCWPRRSTRRARARCGR